MYIITNYVFLLIKVTKHRQFKFVFFQSYWKTISMWQCKIRSVIPAVCEVSLVSVSAISNPGYSAFGAVPCQRVWEDKMMTRCVDPATHGVTCTCMDVCPVSDFCTAKPWKLCHRQSESVGGKSSLFPFLSMSFCRVNDVLK